MIKFQKGTMKHHMDFGGYRKLEMIGDRPNALTNLEKAIKPLRKFVVWSCNRKLTIRTKLDINPVSHIVRNITTFVVSKALHSSLDKWRCSRAWIASRVDSKESIASTKEDPSKYWGREGGGLPKVIPKRVRPMLDWTKDCKTTQSKVWI